MNRNWAVCGMLHKNHVSLKNGGLGIVTRQCVGLKVFC